MNQERRLGKYEFLPVEDYWEKILKESKENKEDMPADDLDELLKLVSKKVKSKDNKSA